MDVVNALLNNPKLKAIFRILADTNCETRVVGGAVRDALSGVSPSEIDLATIARPEVVMTTAIHAGLKVIPTGLSHGTVTVIVDGTPFEVTTLRKDLETDGRYAKVEFGQSFEEDAQRRDFTINALSLSEDGRLYDYTGGMSDLNAKRVRFIGEPEIRIKEDYLRILRFFRFTATYGEGLPDRNGLHYCILSRHALSQLSHERVKSELFKLLVSRRSSEILRIMSESGITSTILGASYPLRLSRLNVIQKTLNEEPDPVLGLAAYTLKIEEDAERLRRRLRLSNKEYDHLFGMARVLIQMNGKKIPPSKEDLLRLILCSSPKMVHDALMLCLAEGSQPENDSQCLEAIQDIKTMPIPFFQISGGDLAARGVAPGPKMGKLLKILRETWIEKGCPSDPDFLDKNLADALAALEIAREAPVFPH